MKKCCYCKKEKPTDNYFINKRAADGHWAWCKECERKARKQSNEMKHCLSFSGGKDSTAMLILVIENKLPLDKIIYFDCEEFEFPEMHEHIEKVKSVLNVEIEVCRTVKPWKQYLQEIGWPAPWLRWCTNEKINSIRRQLRFFRPNTQYIGYAADEKKRINNATKKNMARKRDKWMHYRYPLGELGVTEKKALEICKAYGFDWGGLYDYWDRVSCWCCPFQRDSDLQKLKEIRPKLYKKFLEFDKLCPENHKYGHYKHIKYQHDH